MTPAERIRVFIAGDIYPKRGLVRRFLEDDGYDVVGTTVSRKAMMAKIRGSEPDAVVVDGDLLVAGAAGGTLARIRETVPDAKVIVFTGGPAAGGRSALSGADGYLEKGVGLSALTALLGSMFVAEPPRIVQPGASGTAAAATGVAATAPPSDGPPRGVAAASTGNGPGAVARLVAIASGATLVVWGLIALLANGGGPTPPPLDRTEGDRNGEIVFDSAMDDARASLRGLISAIESGNYVLASIEADALLDARERAKEQGYSISGLDAAITARLGTVVDLLPLRATTELSSILGTLFPEVSDEEVPGGDGEAILGPVVNGGTSGDTSGGQTGAADGAGDVDEGDGGGNDGVEPDPGDDGVDPGPGEDGVDPDPGDDGVDTDPGDDAVLPAELGPGDGREWGQSHKELHEAGILPPWANGNAVGHDEPDHGGPQGISGSPAGVTRPRRERVTTGRGSGPLSLVQSSTR